MSVSTLIIGKGAAMPVSVVNFSMKLSRQDGPVTCRSERSL
jgi:hypothetical protein